MYNNSSSSRGRSSTVDVVVENVVIDVVVSAVEVVVTLVDVVW